MMEFVYLFTPKRENWLATMTLEEQEAIGKHLEYTKRLSIEGKIILAGPTLDGDYGIVVFKAESPEEAQEIYSNDPVVQSGVLNTELHPYKVSILEGRS